MNQAALEIINRQEELEEQLIERAATLPNSVAQRSGKVVVWANGMKWIPIFCANCGKDGGMVMETYFDYAKNWAFYLCEPCAEKWAPLADLMLVPDEIFWRKVRQEILETYGRPLSDSELVEVLKDGSSKLSLLCRDRDTFK